MKAKISSSKTSEGKVTQICWVALLNNGSAARHLKHHIKRYTDKREEEQQSTDTSQTQLLKLQLAAAKKDVERKYKRYDPIMAVAYI